MLSKYRKKRKADDPERARGQKEYRHKTLTDEITGRYAKGGLSLENEKFFWNKKERQRRRELPIYENDESGKMKNSKQPLYKQKTKANRMHYFPTGYKDEYDKDVYESKIYQPSDPSVKAKKRKK